MKITALFIPLLPFCALADPESKPAPPATSALVDTSASALVAIEGTDPSFAELLENGTLKAGERFFKGKVPGSRVRVNHGLLEKQVGKPGPVPGNIRIHTQASGGIQRKDFANWSRWYQEDGNVQVFRLFKGEQNIRGGTGENGSQGRIEAYAVEAKVDPGGWREWEGTFTIVTPLGANIFQLFHNGDTAKGDAILWPFHIRMSDNGDIYFHRRRPIEGMPSRIVLATNMTGKSLSIKVRANGTEYEVYQKNPLDAGPWKFVTKGSYLPSPERSVSFRWGMYVGSKKGQTVPNDGLLLVTGVTMR
jgi:hypothetical protein